MDIHLDVSNITYKANLFGMLELLRQPGARDVIEHATNKVHAAAGDGYISKVYTYTDSTGRYIGIVSPNTPKAVQNNRKHNTLIKALHSA